ncbi:hypothetical protein BB561_004804 [Smittium simulii]|uniref:Reverse transcriptase/retrotransposon-derived protein RNase H-like domain-containing protein n=1 Tax=Smittium simulii TaxID=133385 RepID=A0A2T9YE43_9FUNG|nr:hypothetical protein BB561_004804 [Smittium simulii]
MFSINNIMTESITLGSLSNNNPNSPYCSILLEKFKTKILFDLGAAKFFISGRYAKKLNLNLEKVKSDINAVTADGHGFKILNQVVIDLSIKVGSPLYDLTKGKPLKNAQFLWNAVGKTAFAILTSLLTTHPVLQAPDWKKKFFIETDASAYATEQWLEKFQHYNLKMVYYLGEINNAADTLLKKYDIGTYINKKLTQIDEDE